MIVGTVKTWSLLITLDTQEELTKEELKDELYAWFDSLGWGSCIVAHELDENGDRVEDAE